MSVLVAGIGNIFLGDDGFGVEVARRLLERPATDGITVADFGIRGFDLAYALMDGHAHAILVDAVAGGEPPGTLYLIEPEAPNAARGGPEPHSMDPRRVLDMVERFGGTTTKIRIVACEPERISEDDGIGLSPVVAAAVDGAILLIDEILGRLDTTVRTAGTPRAPEMEVRT